VPSILAYWDDELRCRFANRAYEKWFGVSPDQLIGTSMRDLLGPKLFAMNEPHMRAALAGEHQIFERIVPGPGGVERHSLAEYIPDIVDGCVRGFLVQVTEVTQLRQTQAALTREKQLRLQIEDHAAAMAALLQERTDMLYVLAHEVRQPLNNASAALQSTQSALASPHEALAPLQVARAQAVLGQVLASIDNTLAVAALLGRQDPIHREDTDVDTLIAVVIADMHASERGRIRVLRQSSIRTALMDMSLIRLALRNVLSNALKYSAPRTPVSVSVADSDEPLALVIDVSDTGLGIPIDLLPRLFSRGGKGNESSAGLGLGLYIVQQVMALHGGSVELIRNGPTETIFRLSINQSISDG